MSKKTVKEEVFLAINNILSRKKGTKYAKLSEIYAEVAAIKKVKLDKSLKSQVRGRLQEHCSQYSNFLGKEELFETKKIRSGLWRNRITGENKLKEYVFQIIKEFPGIDITSLQKNLLVLIKDELTAADKLESLTRPGEMKIEQIIRNFVSHKESYKDEIDFVNDANGITRLYLKEKTISKLEELELKNDNKFEKMEALIELEKETPIVSKNESELIIEKEVPKLKKRKKENNRTYIRKSDLESYLKEYKKKLNNGYTAEALVYKYEKNKLCKMGRKDLAKKIQWISRDCGDGYGYDIKSFEIIGEKVKEIFIEVKSTGGSLGSDFEMSQNELEFAKSHIENYKLYRISHKNGKNTGYILEKEWLQKVEIIPSNYKVSLKTD